MKNEEERMKRKREVGRERGGEKAEEHGGGGERYGGEFLIQERVLYGYK